MYIKEIEFRNFKTFQREKIPLFPEFIAVTGPNGSGKSNIIDGIMFTLGLTSSRKALRAEDLTSFIHKGKGSRPDTAEVTLTFDNRDRRVDIDRDEFTVSRRVKINPKGEAHSTYYLDGHPASKEEILGKLSKANISPEGHNVVLQGDINKIVQMTTGELRLLIDEVAGVAEFDERRERAKEELNLVRERVREADIRLGEQDEALRQLEAQRNVALEYEKVLQEKTRLEGHVRVARLRNLESEEAKQEKGLQGLGEREEKLRALQEEAQGRVDGLERNLEAVEMEIAATEGEEALKIRRQVEEVKEGTGRCGSAAEALGERLRAVEEEAQRLAVRREEKTEALRQREGTLREQSDAREIHAKELDGVQRQIEKHTGGRGGEDAEARRLHLDEARRLLADRAAERERLQREMDDRLLAARRRSGDLEGARRQQEDLQSQLQHLEEQQRERVRGEEAARLEEARLERETGELEQRRSRTDVARAAAQSRLIELQRELTKRESMASGLQMGRYSQGVTALLEAIRRQELPGVHGAIGELAAFPPRYAAALEAAAGSRVEWLVAATVDDVQHARDYFRKRGLPGRVTFLPLDKLPKKVLGPLKSGAGIVDYALNLVDYDPRFEAAFWIAFGDTVVVEDFEAAKSHMGRFRMSTLEGELFEKIGAITVGQPPSRAKVAKTTEREVEKLREEVAEAEAALRERQQELAGIDEAMANLKRRRADLQVELAQAERDLQSLQTSMASLRSEVERRAATLQEMEGQSATATGSIAELEARRDGLTREIERLDADKAEMEKTVAAAPDRLQQLREAEETRGRLAATLQEIDTQLRVLESQREAIARELQETEEALRSREGEAQEARGRLRDLEKEARDLERSMAQLRRQEEELSQASRTLRDRREALVADMGKAREKLHDLQRDQEELQREREQRDTARQVIQAELSRLQEETRGLEAPERLPPAEEMEAEIRVREAELARFGPVNQRAIQDYEATAGRRRELSERRNKLMEERGEILERIEKCEKMKRDAFFEAFDAINENFQKLFAELSDGRGELILENKQEPFEGGMSIKAQPKGKTMMGLMARSGGEKSLIALSLLLAIQQHKPAPFYAFDEVDMHLDGLNVERVARLLQRCSGQAQFIVVSLREPMIQAATRTLGVSMQQNDISTITGILLHPPTDGETQAEAGA
ncbi:MAG: chromosome segregation protein SMC [Euryarchaeota archaeon]|nr:chromosome segregation protein SMC [Euryarchaeota archaeon]